MQTDREIFGPYWNGLKQVWGDPLALYRRLSQALEGQLHDWIGRFNDEADPRHEEACERLCVATGWAFGCKTFDPDSGEGLLVADLESLLRAYLEWLEGNEYRAVRTPTSAQPTAQEPSPSAPKKDCGCC